jgi:uncharacterized protein YprB with RNaseH-like and TPR domain
MRTGFFDIETTGFSHESDKIIVICIANDMNSKVKIIKSDKMSERDVINSAVRELNKYRSIVSWNGMSFDVPFLTKRAQIYGIKFNHKSHIDLRVESLKIFPNIDKSLESMALTFMIDKEKTPFDTSIWRMAKNGDKDAMEYIIEHCSNDVLLLKELWKRIK